MSLRSHDVTARDGLSLNLWERSPESGQPADDLADAFAAVADRFSTIHLVGVSWGTTVCGRFVARDRPAVASLTQCAPVYRTPYDIEDGLDVLGLDPDLDACRTD